MRQELCEALVRRAGNPKMVFLTGDLGFMALEPLREALGERFINAGVSEQNMISVAAAMAREGLEVWAYSIAPFCYARPFEQIRNDICLHNLPVKLLGNGGGYGYGVMGPTHHAIEDYGALLTLQGMRAFVPAYHSDVEPVITAAADCESPCYVRLGRCQVPTEAVVPEYRPWRRVVNGPGPVVVCVGPLIETWYEVLSTLPAQSQPSLWLATQFPFAVAPPPNELLSDINSRQRLLVMEEHVAHAGASAMLCQWLIQHHCKLEKYEQLCALGYPTGRYGSQLFFRKQSALDAQSVKQKYMQLMSIE